MLSDKSSNDRATPDPQSASVDDVASALRQKRRNILKYGAFSLGGAALAGLWQDAALATSNNEGANGDRLEPTWVVPSPRTLTEIEAELRKVLALRPVDGLEDARARLDAYRDAILNRILARRDAFHVVGIDFFKGEEGASLRDSFERLGDTIMNLLPHSEEVHTAQLSDCDKALVEGLAEITVGAIFGGPLGALSGFILGVVDLALNC